ncbi:MAG: YciI family protein [Gammaproteobacteria bacterium]|nr:YciI family protein [Gammaproteobacteria bacterium]
MLFAIIAQDVENSLSARLEARPAHVERLKALDIQNRLTLAGPHPHATAEGFTGSLVVAEFADLTEAQEWANQDPYIAAGVYAHVTVKPFKQVFPT